MVANAGTGKSIKGQISALPRKSDLFVKNNAGKEGSSSEKMRIWNGNYR